MAKVKNDAGSHMETWPTGEYVGSYRSDDPRHRLVERARTASAEGMVIVPAALIREVYQMRVCRATKVMTHDEDGKLSGLPTTAHCVEQAGHSYRHSNGYWSWED